MHQFKVQLLLSDYVKEKENVDWYEPKIAKFNDFICQTEIWLKQSLADVHDNVSIVSYSSSKASSAHSAWIQIVVDEAGLLARAKSLREKHEMEMEKVKLRAKMEALQLRRSKQRSEQAELHHCSTSRHH